MLFSVYKITPAQMKQKLTSFSFVRLSPIIMPQKIASVGLRYWQIPVVISGRFRTPIA